MLTIAHASHLRSLEPDLTVCAEPAFVIDPAAATLRAANRLGWQVWGINPNTVQPSIAIDAAMPALQSLRGRDASGSIGAASPPSGANLVFWTFRGLVRMHCRLEPVGGAVPAWVVRVLACEPALGIAARADRQARAVADGPREARGHPLTAKAPELALTAKLAHELRTPLSAVIAYAEILKDEHFGPLADARYRGYANDIYNSARHALGVVDGMLRSEAHDSGVPQLAFADLDPACVIDSCLIVARPLAEQAGLELGVEYAPRLPRVIADELSLKQMLINLLANAIKFTRRGDRITVAAAYECNGSLRISVADTGPGIAPALDGQPDRSELLPTHGGPSAGLGFGLPFTKVLAAANGATVAVESRLGHGTRVTIAFGKDRLVPV
jgi:two-component system, cell cycle sensor histidine kinase PleC